MIRYPLRLVTAALFLLFLTTIAAWILGLSGEHHITWDGSCHYTIGCNSRVLWVTSESQVSKGQIIAARAELSAAGVPMDAAMQEYVSGEYLAHSDYGVFIYASGDQRLFRQASVTSDPPWSSRPLGTLWQVWIPFWVPLIGSLPLPGWALFRVARRRSRGLCPTCSYNLTGNTSGVCPEYGTPVPQKSEAAT